MIDWRQTWRDLSKTTVASVIATALDGLVFFILTRLELLDGLSYAVGARAFCAAPLGGVPHPTLCKYWVYGRFARDHRSALPRYVLMSASAALLHGAITQGLSALWFGAWAWGLSKVLIYLGWTFPLSRYVVFGRLHEGPQA
jgi:hypothetical protein